MAKKNKKSVFYRVIKKIMKLIQPEYKTNRSLGGDLLLLIFLLL